MGGSVCTKMQEALLNQNWGEVAGLAARTAQKFSKVTVPEHHRLGTPWQGAWQEFEKNQ